MPASEWWIQYVWGWKGWRLIVVWLIFQIVRMAASLCWSGLEGSCMCAQQRWRQANPAAIFGTPKSRRPSFLHSQCGPTFLEETFILKGPRKHSPIISREGLILTLSILPCPQGRISRCTALFISFIPPLCQNWPLCPLLPFIPLLHMITSNLDQSVYLFGRGEYMSKKSETVYPGIGGILKLSVLWSTKKSSKPSIESRNIKSTFFKQWWRISLRLQYKGD